jgi:DNA-binding CsgD family transcriptional regulator
LPINGWPVGEPASWDALRRSESFLVHLAVRAAIFGADADTVAGMAERALNTGRLLIEQTHESVVPFLPLYQLMCADRRLDLVGHCLEVAFARARQDGSLFGFAYASTFRSHLARIRGALADAEADALQGLDVAARVPGWRFALAGVLDALVSVFLERGKVGEAEAALAEHGLAGELADSVPARLLLASRGHLRLAQGRTREGVADLLELIDREERTGPANLCLTPHRSLAALGLARLGDVDRAISLADGAVVRARVWRAAAGLGTALRHAGLVHGGNHGLELLAEAAEVLEGSSAVVARAWALIDLGAALRRAGRRSEAVDLLRSGMDLAHQCGADPLAARARQELVAAGARPRRRAITGVESLTASERRICQLAVQGMTNREIAQALFVTLRTVEVHLTHAYQKLQIASREELPRSLLS